MPFVLISSNILGPTQNAGENIPAGKKSCALSFILRDDAKTLTDTEIDSVVGKLINAYEKKLGAVVRKA